MLDTPGDPGTVSSGVPELDRALGGLYWGDNVVWERDEGASVEPFYHAIAARVSDYQVACYVTVATPPEEVEASFPTLNVMDARPGTALGEPGALLDEVGRTFAAERSLAIFDPLETMAGVWGVEAALGFFARGCPLLLDLGAIAYWSLGVRETAPDVRRRVHEVTQCVITVGEDRVRIRKAEARPAGAEGSVFRYRHEDGGLELLPAAARVGAALRALRAERGLRQHDLAELAGVSASAIGQAERGQTSLSLDTLLELTARLGITLDELLRGHVTPSYKVARRGKHEQTEQAPAPLFDDPHAGLRVYLVQLPPRGQAQLDLARSGTELIAVASGLIQAVLPSGRPVLRAGEALLAEHGGIWNCTNIGDQDATAFWILGPASAAGP